MWLQTHGRSPSYTCCGPCIWQSPPTCRFYRAETPNATPTNQPLFWDSSLPEHLLLHQRREAGTVILKHVQGKHHQHFVAGPCSHIETNFLDYFKCNECASNRSFENLIRLHKEPTREGTLWKQTYLCRLETLIPVVTNEALRIWTSLDPDVLKANSMVNDIAHAATLSLRLEDDCTYV